MRNDVITFYFVRSFYPYDESGPDTLFSSSDKNAAQAELYKHIVNLSVETGLPVIKEFESYQVGEHSLYIDKKVLSL